MLLLVTGASGVGKSTVRRALAPRLQACVETAEIASLGVTPEWNLAWRHRMVERLVQHALDAQAQRRHFLICGDPVPPGEVVAAPSASRLGPIAVCLLDADPAAQRERLAARGDDLSLLPQHQAFAAWMRRHVVDHRHRADVITGGGWDAMRWERWTEAAVEALPWRAHVIDTSHLGPDEVVAQVAAWIEAVLPPPS